MLPPFGRTKPVAAALILMVASATTSIAQDAWLRGEWCAVNGDETLMVAGGGFNFTDNLACKWREQPQTGSKLSTQAACTTYSAEGSKGDETMLSFRAVKTGPQSISVRLGPGSAIAFGKC
jgi:hypothetical protein